ncbi:MAG: hypothetical protein KAS97_09090 [Candidatus Aminicenantes bacterium]|nr:hypothetical protein [Candidatus Aminicenantes bacterium]
MTEASVRALDGLRDLSMLKWYVIPLLAIVFYIYVKEIKDARSSGNWNAVFAGLTVFGIDFFNETWNGWVLALTGKSAFWTTPGDTALRTMVGWNIEIMFMFLLSGIIWYHTCSEDPKDKILGIPNRWFWAIGYSVFCVFVEVLLNKGGLLIWEYSFWNRSFGGVLLVFLIGYFHFYVGSIFVISRKSIRSKVIILGIIYLIPILMNIFGYYVMGWNY